MRGFPKPGTVVCAAVWVASLAVWTSAQSPVQETQRPQFKAGVEIMRIEATVLDQRTRQPIRGLTIGDFVIKVNGEPQEVVALTETVAPGVEKSPANWAREAPAPFAISADARETAAVVMTLAVSLDDPVAQGQVEPLDLDTRIFDAEGRKQLVEHRQTVRLGAKADPGTPYEIAQRHDLRPGRYHVRIGALLADGRSGGVHATFTVPRFSRDALSLSGVAIGRAGAPPVGGREVLDGLLTFAPTLARVFTRDDIVGALVHVHQAPNRVSSADVETRITNAAGTVVHRRATAYTPSQFAASGHVEHRFELPLKTLEPGDYLMTFAATIERRATVTRDVRFSVRR